MNAKDAIVTSMQMSQMVLDGLLKDLADADLLVRPAPSANHIAWQLGHLISSEQMMIESTCPNSCPALPEGFAANHSKERSKSDETAGFLSKQEYLDLFRRQREATLKALNDLPEADLDKEAPESFRQLCPTVGSVFALQGDHVLMHSGQFSVVRRKLGKPVVF
jgi:hypothetical protein